MLNVNLFSRSITTTAMTALIVVLANNGVTVGQERQGCFMVGPNQQLVSLNDICPTPEPFNPTGAGGELGTGDVQVTLRWATTDDLDLAVTSPNGERVYWENPGPVASGGTLDRDDNSECVTISESPIENIFWPSGRGLDGLYTVEVDLFDRCSFDDAPIDFELRILVKGVTEVVPGAVDDDNPIFTYDFPVPLPNESISE